jgi:hypothetical protein
MSSDDAYGVMDRRRSRQLEIEKRLVAKHLTDRGFSVVDLKLIPSRDNTK